MDLMLLTKEGIQKISNEHSIYLSSPILNGYSKQLNIYSE